MSRRTDLEARRQALLSRCAQQRVEMSRQLAQLRSAGVLGLPSLGAGGAWSTGDGRHHPLAWLIAIAGVLLLGRTREVLKILVWARTALGVASRVTQVVRFLVSLRPPRTPRGRAKVPVPPTRESVPPARSASG
jgi:hypothetical protein